MVGQQPWVLFVYTQGAAVPGEKYQQQRDAQSAEEEKKLNRIKGRVAGKE